jgi:2,3-bisphosphoglycerate-independent phosphoglycerate mutase
MKYVIVIPDGAADLPNSELAGKTPLEAANIPHIDQIAREGRCGGVRNIPDGLPLGSDVAIMSLAGYDPLVNYSGRAPLEAAAMDLQTRDDEWIFRCNLVEIRDGVMRDYSAANISNDKARNLIDSLNSRLSNESIRFYPGVSYRNLMTIRGEMNVTTTPPHNIVDQPISSYLPKGEGAQALRSLIEESQELLAGFKDTSATSIWLWGEGKPRRLKSFEQRFGLRGAVIAAVDLVRGIGRLIGWDVVDVPGATGYYDTDYRAKGAAAIKALEDHELAFVHVEATDEAGHEGNPKQKITALERIDVDIVGPLVQSLKSFSAGWRILLLPDHFTPCSIRKHTPDPVPYCMSGTGIESDEIDAFSEAFLLHRSTSILKGHELMGVFIS